MRARIAFLPRRPEFCPRHLWTCWDTMLASSRVLYQPSWAVRPLMRCSSNRFTTAAMLPEHCTGPCHALAATAVALLLVQAPAPALAEELVSSPIPTVYFGSGCFWGRQKDFVDAELGMGRSPEAITAVVGYAGGTHSGPAGRVCYYYNDPSTVYERLGHAEVTQVQLDKDPAKAADAFRQFAHTYFQRQFRQTRFGMSRLDPQDVGPGYRNIVGLPGGVLSPLFSILQNANIHNMDLREGRGNEFVNGTATEGDLFNTVRKVVAHRAQVWIVDTNTSPFYQAERYHQFHNGVGEAFSITYTRDLKQQVAANGRIPGNGCQELPF